MSEILSQEQIDALMASEGLDAGESSSPLGGDGGGGDAGGGAKDYSALSAGFKPFLGSVQDVLNTLINKSINCEVEESKQADKESVGGIFTEPVLDVVVPFEGELDGTIHFLLTRQSTALLSDLMMMGDGTAEYADEHKDAIGEIFNQIIGAFTTALGDVMSQSPTSGAIEVKEYEPENPPVNFETTDMVHCKLTVEDFPEFPLCALVPGDITEKLIATGGGEADGSGGESGGIGLDSGELDALADISSSPTDSSGDFTTDDFGGGGGGLSSSGDKNIDMLLDIELDVCIELGSTRLPIKRVLELAPGSIVELERMAGEPVDLLVNDKVVAKGEIVVVDESFGIRILSLVSPEERIKSLR